MKKAGLLIKEMGFNPNASDSAKEAFIKYLIKQSTGENVQTPTEKRIMAENPKKILSFSKQLEFDLDDESAVVDRKKA